MKIMWYDGYQTVSDNRFFQSFRDYVLIPYVDDRPNNLDSLEDEVFDEQDDLLQENGHTYTKEIEEYLKSKSKMTLDKLKDIPLKELTENIPLGKLKEAIGKDFPDDYKLKDVKNTFKTEQLITPFKEKDALEQEYTLKDFEKRLQDAVFGTETKAKLKGFLTYDENSPKNQIILKFNMRSDTPEETHGKIKWYENLGIEVALHKPEKARTSPDSDSTIVEISQNLKDDLGGVLRRTKPKQGESKKAYEELLIDTIFENKKDLERIIIKNTPKDILDKDVLYDFTMTLTMFLRPISENKLYDIDDRRTIRKPRNITNEKGEPETIYVTEDNPNYGKFKLDDEGKKMPKFEGDELDNLVEIKTVWVKIKTAILKPKTTMAATTGQTERVKGLGRAGITAGRTGEYTSDKINDARGYYLKQIKARLQKLEEAISDIPIAKEE